MFVCLFRLPLHTEQGAGKGTFSKQSLSNAPRHHATLAISENIYYWIRACVVEDFFSFVLIKVAIGQEKMKKIWFHLTNRPILKVIILKLFWLMIMLIDVFLQCFLINRDIYKAAWAVNVCKMRILRTL